MKIFFKKVGRFFWSWGFLKFVLWTVTIIVLLYVEEDWRGARDWAATKAKWEAKGESFDPAKFIPPSVPDEQNLGALPLFKLESVQEDGISYKIPVTLQKAIRNRLPGNKLPSLGNWQSGGFPDMAKIKFALAANYSEAFKGKPVPQDTLAQVDALYPFISDLRTAAAVRPFFRLPEDYAVSPPGERSLMLIADQIAVSKILMFHAVIALNEHLPDLALEDIKLNNRLTLGVERDPSLLAGLVAIGMRAISNSIIGYGLALHSWDDAQLASLQGDLARFDFLAGYQSAMRGELATESLPDIEYIKKGGIGWMIAWTGGPGRPDSSSKRDVTNFWADGWLDQNKRQLADKVLNGIRDVDPVSHRVFADQVDEHQKQFQQDKGRTMAIAPWNILVTVSGPLLSATSKFAQAQVYVDEARIACALERYRIVHNVYPDSLDALVPACIPEVPLDVINGKPYRYQLRPDGTYLLYSVGWNQMDEGGEIVHSKDHPDSVDPTQGDWVWPMSQLKTVK